MAALESGNAALIASGLFYAVLCVFSVVTGAIYLAGKRQLNPVELPDRFVRRMDDEGKLERFARTMGLVTIVVGIVQGASAYAILFAHGAWARWLAVGFTIFSLCSVLFKLKGKISTFPLLKLGAYVAVLIVLLV